MADVQVLQRLLDLIRQFHRTIQLGLNVPHKMQVDHFRRAVWKERGLGPAIAENVASLGLTADAFRLRRALDNFYGIIDPPISVQRHLFSQAFVVPLHRHINELANVLGDIVRLINKLMGPTNPPQPNNKKKRRGRPPKKETQELAKFAKPYIDQGKGWGNITDEYISRHPKKAKELLNLSSEENLEEDNKRALSDKIRNAYNSEYSPKKRGNAK